MKNVIFPDEIITCDCGFKGGLIKMAKHFKNTWTWNQTELVSAVNKHGHTRVLN